VYYRHEDIIEPTLQIHEKTIVLTTLLTQLQTGLYI